MINQFFNSWNSALQARKVIRENNRDGMIVSQETEFEFRGVKIRMFSRLRPGDERKPENQRRWISELFVPSTNKIIPSVTFQTKAKCAAAILACLIEGRDHEDRVQSRIQMKKAHEIKERNNQWTARLVNTSFNNDVDFIIDWITSNSVQGRSSWNDDLINTLVKYDYFITGVGLADKVSLCEKDLALHTQRMFNTSLALLISIIKDRNGIDIIPRSAISKYFLEPKEGIPQGVYVVRSAFSKINDMCPYSNKMAYIIKFISEYLAVRVFNTTVEKGIADMRAYRESKFNRMSEKDNNHKKHNHSKNNNGTRAFSTNNLTPITSMGDVFGDVLDNVAVAAPSTKQSVGKKHKQKLVTDKQINGKISTDKNNQLQAKRSEELKSEKSIEEEQAEFARSMMEEEANNNSVVEEFTNENQDAVGVDQSEIANATTTEETINEQQPVVDSETDTDETPIEPVEESVQDQNVDDMVQEEPVEKVSGKSKKSRKRKTIDEILEEEDREVLARAGRGKKRNTKKSSVDLRELELS